MTTNEIIYVAVTHLLSYSGQGLAYFSLFLENNPYLIE
jgi:hypothetical protein